MTLKNIVPRSLGLKCHSLYQKIFFRLLRERDETLKLEKRLRKKILIWHTAGEMVKKHGRAEFYLLCNYFFTLYFLVKVLLVKLKNLETSACLNLNNGKTKQKPKM